MLTVYQSEYLCDQNKGSFWLCSLPWSSSFISCNCKVCAVCCNMQLLLSMNDVVFVFVGEDDNFRPRYLAIDHHTDIMSHGLLLLDKFLVRLDLD